MAPVVYLQFPLSITYSNCYATGRCLLDFWGTLIEHFEEENNLSLNVN